MRKKKESQHLLAIMKLHENNVHVNIENKEWSSLSYEEKNRLLFLRQKETLDMFLDRGAISQASTTRASMT